MKLPRNIKTTLWHYTSTAHNNKWSLKSNVSTLQSSKQGCCKKGEISPEFSLIYQQISHEKGTVFPVWS